MVKKTSIVATIIIVGAAIFLLLQNGYFQAESETPHRIYYADNISPAHQIVIDRFNELYRGKIEVVPVNLPFDKFTTNERKELLARSLRNKSDRIDIFSVDLIWVSRFSKWSEPLDNVVREEERKNILSYALESCYAESMLVAVPLYLDIGMLYYRRDLLKKLPDWEVIEEKLRQSITWDEFLGLQSKLGYRSKPFYAFAAKDYEGLVCNYFEMVESQSETAVNKHAINLEGEAAHVALQTMVDFVQRRGVSPKEVTEFDENRCYDFMLQNDGMFWRGWPNFIENYNSFYPDKEKLRNIGRAALPHVEGKQPRSVFGGWNLMISKYSNNKQQAIKFITFLQSEEIQKLFFQQGGYLPANRKVYEDTTFMRQHPDLVYYRQLLDRGFHRPALPEYTKISDVISHYVHRALKGEIGVADALRKASEVIHSSRIGIE